MSQTADSHNTNTHNCAGNLSSSISYRGQGQKKLPDETESSIPATKYQQLLSDYERIKHERDMLCKVLRVFNQHTIDLDR